MRGVKSVPTAKFRSPRSFKRRRRRKRPRSCPNRLESASVLVVPDALGTSSQVECEQVDRWQTEHHVAQTKPSNGISSIIQQVSNVSRASGSISSASSVVPFAGIQSPNVVSDQGDRCQQQERISAHRYNYNGIFDRILLSMTTISTNVPIEAPSTRSRSPIADFDSMTTTASNSLSVSFELRQRGHGCICYSNLLAFATQLASPSSPCFKALPSGMRNLNFKACSVLFVDFADAISLDHIQLFPSMEFAPAPLAICNHLICSCICFSFPVSLGNSEK